MSVRLEGRYVTLLSMSIRKIKTSSGTTKESIRLWTVNCKAYGRTQSFVLQFTVIIFVSKERELSRGTSVMMSGHSSGFYRNPVTRPRRPHPPQVDLQNATCKKAANNEQSGVAVMFWTCFRKVVFSNVGRIAGYHDGDFYGFRQPSQANVGI